VRLKELPRVRRFPTGKVPADSLKRIVLSRLGLSSSRLLQGPGVGEDAAILDYGDRVLVVATDPIIGALGNVGRLAVHVNANDVASCGARPLWFLCVTLLPEGSGEAELEEIMEQLNAACSEVGVSLIGGHTETTPDLERPILIGFMMGEAPKDNYVKTGGALPGDVLIMTKTAGIEGTAVLARDLTPFLHGRVGEEALQVAKSMLGLISVVPEAMESVKLGGVHSLHDPTEGGVLNGVWEMVEAAGVGVIVREEDIPIAEETRQICDALGIDPLKLLGSGALLLAVDQEKADEMVSALRAIGVETSIIGEVKPEKEGRIIIRKDGLKETITAVDQDHLYKILDEHGI